MRGRVLLSWVVMWQRIAVKKRARTYVLGKQLPIHEVTTMAFTTTIPILRILDETKAKEFYVDFLGFKVDWEHRAEGPLYMQVSLGECLLQLSEHSGDAGPGAAVKIFTDAIEEYVEELGITLAPAHQGHGFATEALGSVLRYVFDTLGKHRALAVTDARNHPAAGLFRRLGFPQEAHLVEHVWFKGAWGSENVFALLHREWQASRTRGCT
jgi:GNAT superfamily N-acetyltransferase